MKLHRLKIEGFRRVYDAEIFFDDATFLIGINNVGKSSVLKAIDYLLSDTKKLEESEYYAILKDGENLRFAGKVVFEAEFRNVPNSAINWRGFKGRILNYNVSDSAHDTGKSFVIRKTFEFGKDVVVQMLQQERILKSVYSDCTTINDYLSKGLNLIELFPELQSLDKDKKLTTTQKTIFEEELYDFNPKNEDWFTNPGGIPGNVLSKLPKYIFIPAQHSTDELDGTKGALVKTLDELFNEIRDESENFKEAQRYLNMLALELDPEDKDKEVGKMINEIDTILSDVFPNTRIIAKASLTDPNSAIKPSFTIEMSSNVRTPVKYQGTGVIRSAVFALLRYKSQRDMAKHIKDEYVRPLIIGFEEPELYLHPHAAKKMRETVYNLAEENNQIICTTHSTYMIDLSKKPKQILNNMTIKETTEKLNDDGYEVLHIDSKPFNVTSALEQLRSDEKEYVKMLMRFDDEIVKVFFAKRVIVVEGDTEYLIIQESIRRMKPQIRQNIEDTWHIIRARGKASIIPLVTYLKILNINVSVIHDKDTGVEGAEKFNLPIQQAIADSSKCHIAVDYVEDLLGYKPPANDKPYKAFVHIRDNWPECWDSVTDPWREFLEKALEITKDGTP